MTSSVPKRIGILTWDFTDGKGGLGRALGMMEETLQESGRVTTVFTPDRGFLRFTKNVGGHLLFSLLLLFTLDHWLKRHSVDLLIIPTGPGGIFLFRKPKHCAFICVCYHTYAQQARAVPGEKWKRIFILFERRTLALADKILVYSRDTQVSLLPDYGVTPEHVTLLPQMLPTEKWYSSEVKQKRKGFCICVARLERRKGVIVLLDAWKEVHAAIPDATLLIVGDGVERNTIDRRIEEIGNSVRRVPNLPVAELIQVVQQADMAICPSYLEGFGLAAAEAMLAGTALLASDCEGLRSLITHRETGLLVPPGDHQILADTLIDLLRSDELRATLARNAQMSALHIFEPKNARAAFLDVIR